MDTLNKIKQLLKENKLNQKDLTDYLCINKNAFTNWSNGSNKSYIKHLPQIAEFFNVSIDYLAGREEKQDDLLHGTWHGGRETKKESTILAYSGNERIDSIAKEILKTDLSEDDLKLIEFILDKYKK